MFWLRFRDRFVHLRIILLDSKLLDYECKLSADGKEVLDYVLDHLNLMEREYFGLRYLDSNDQVHWLSTTKSLKKQLKKCNQPYSFYFCVKFYAAEPAQLQEEVTRYQFFVQIKQDIHHGRLPVPFDALAELGACALQSEVGDFDPNQHEPGYSADFEFTPERTGRLDKKIETIHKSLRGLNPAEAEVRFLTYAKCLDLYGVDLHPVLGEVDVSDPYTTDSGYFLGLSPSGIMMVHNDDKICEFPWKKILTIAKDIWSSSSKDKGGSIIIRVQDRDHKITTLGFRLATRDACKHLWKTAMEHMQFYKKRGKLDSRCASRASKLARFGSLFRASSRMDSDSGSTGSHRRMNRTEPKVQRPSSIRTPRVRSDPRVIYENDQMTVVLEDDGDVKKHMKMPPPEDVDCDRLGDLRSRGARNHSINARGGSISRRSESPVSVQSSFSTNPRRLHDLRIPDIENDDDSVFSGMSRISKPLSEAETLRRKRKRSVLANSENHSSGTSEETDTLRGTELRHSLGPQRRKGKPPVRHQTVDGEITRQALNSLQSSPSRMDMQGKSMNLANTLASVLRPAKSFSYVNGHGSSSPDMLAGRSAAFDFKLDFPIVSQPTTQAGHASLGRRQLFAQGERYGGLSNSQSCTTELSLRTPVERPQTSLPSTPLKPFRDFDVVPESQTLFVSPKEAETPKHIRSFSTSETKSDVSRNKTSRSRLRSDSQFLHHDIPLPDHHEEPSNHERSPLMSPFPILAPPTPFTESATDSQPPTVPARPSSSLKQIPEGAGRRLGVNKVRTDSFTTAVNHGYMEMQVMRSDSERADKEHLKEETLYDTVYDAIPSIAEPKKAPAAAKTNCEVQRQVVEVDVHASSFRGANAESSENGHHSHDYEDVYGTTGNGKTVMKANGIDVSVNGPQKGFGFCDGLVGTVHNQMYFDMTSKEIHPAISKHRLHQHTVFRPVPVVPAQRMVLSANYVALGHPLAVYSTSAEICGGNSSPRGKEDTRAESTRTSPLSRLHSAYATGTEHLGSTDI